MQRLRIESGLDKKGARWFTLRLQFIHGGAKNSTSGETVGSEVAYLMNSAEFAELREFVNEAPEPD